MQVLEPQQIQGPEITQPDWDVEAEKNKQHSGRSTSGQRTFGKAEHDGDPDGPPNASLETTSPRRAGYIEVLGPGFERHWLSSRCYREFGGPPSLLAASGFKAHPITCLTGSGSVDGALFDHLKPEYLRQKD